MSFVHSVTALHLKELFFNKIIYVHFKKASCVYEVIDVVVIVLVTAGGVYGHTQVVFGNSRWCNDVAVEARDRVITLAVYLSSFYVWEILHGTISKMTKQVGQLQSEVEESRDKLDAAKRKVLLFALQ